jgi:hypothetical protein
MITSKHQILIGIIIGIIIIFFLYNRSEDFTTPSSTTPLSATEACQNIASVYNAGTLSATNINATGTLTAPNIVGTNTFKNGTTSIDPTGTITVGEEHFQIVYLLHLIECT